MVLVAVLLIKKNREFLIGKSIPAEKSEAIIELLVAEPCIEKVIDFKSTVLDVGRYHLKCEVEWNGAALLNEIIGEDDLKGRIASRRRLASRIRRRLEFGPLTQQDVAFFFRQAMGAKASPEVTAMINHHGKGDWRPVLTAAIALERAMHASNTSEISMEMVKDVLKNS